MSIPRSEAGLRRRLVVLTALVGLVASTTGCDLRLALGALDGTDDPPARYREEVFASVERTDDLTYGQAVDQLGNDVTLRLDLYQPVGDTVSQRPALVLVHGGGFSGGHKRSAEIVDMAETFAAQGYVTISISYRLHPDGCSFGGVTSTCYTAIVQAKHDAQAAVRWLRANAATYGVDADRIAIGGSSAGAITALNVGYSPDDPGTSGNPGHASDVGLAISLSGGAVFSPSPGEAPALLFHGTSDSVVPHDWAASSEADALAAGLPAKLVTWDGAGHVPYLGHRDEIIETTSETLYFALGLDAAPRA